MFKFLTFICIAFLIAMQTCFAQSEVVDSLRASFDHMYGLDVILTNGRKYYADSKPVIGHPFWRNDSIFTGDLTISGRKFSDRQLKYNLAEQEFILFYKNSNGQDEQVILPSEAIDSVRIGKYLFIPNKHPEIKESFVQSIYSRKLNCYISWHKELTFNSTGVNTGYKYTKETRTYYLLRDNQVYPFSNRSTFLKAFPKDARGNIRQYFRKHLFNFKELDGGTLKMLLSYCEKII